MAWGKTPEGEALGTGMGLWRGWLKDLWIGSKAKSILSSDSVSEAPQANVVWAHIPVQHTFKNEQLKKLKSVKLAKETTKTSKSYTLFYLEDILFEEKKVNGKKIKIPKWKKIRVLWVSLMNVDNIQAGKNIELFPVTDNSKQFVNSIIFSQYWAEDAKVEQFLFEERQEEKLLKESDVRKKQNLRIKTQSGKEITVYYRFAFEAKEQWGVKRRVKKCVIEGFSNSTIENMIATQKDRSTSKIKFKLTSLPKELQNEIITAIIEHEKSKSLKESDITFVKQDDVRAVAIWINNRQKSIREKLWYAIVQKTWSPEIELTWDIGEKQMKIAKNILLLHKLTGEKRKKLEKENADLRAQISKLLSVGHSSIISNPESTRYIEIDFWWQKLTVLVEIKKTTRKTVWKWWKSKVENEAFEIVVKWVIDLRLNAHNVKQSLDAKKVLDSWKKTQISYGKFIPWSDLYFIPLKKSQLLGIFERLQSEITRCMKQSGNPEWTSLVQNTEIVRSMSWEWVDENQNWEISQVILPRVWELVKWGYQLEIEWTWKNIDINDALRLQYKKDTWLFYAVNWIKWNKITQWYNELVIFWQVKQIKWKKIILETPKNTLTKVATAKSVLNFETEGKWELMSEVKASKMVKDAVVWVLKWKKTPQTKKWKVRYFQDSQNTL